jgi:membrane protein YqaA with SNARE-associated domain
MKLFRPLYDRAIVWAQHKRATAILAILSFFEAIIFPVMPEVMLAPMSIARPKRALWYATVSLLAGLAGSVVGYELGHYAYEAIGPMLPVSMQTGIQGWVDTLQTKMRDHPGQLFGFLLLAAIQPVIPMKFVTWGAGIAGVPMPEFLLCVLIGRGKRLYLVAGAIRIGGERAANAIQKYIEPLGWIALVILVVAAGYLWLHGAST